ncbi:MAG TPA: hypothetical protein VKU80_16170 [Planctomycetota bacterium]|nr:hypothetical protein [Planctomycetota bacterium]
MLVAGLLVAALAQESQELPRAREPRWDQMEYGPFLTTALTMPWPRRAVTPEGIVAKLGTGATCFDTDLLRYAAAWDGGWLELLGPPFEGARSPDDKTPVHRMLIKFLIKAADGTPLSQRIWHTNHKNPQ